MEAYSYAENIDLDDYEIQDFTEELIPPYVIDACYTSIKNKKISIKRDGEEVRILCDTPYGSCQITWDGDEWLLNDKGDLPDELVDLLNCTII